MDFTQPNIFLEAGAHTIPHYKKNINWKISSLMQKRRL